VQSLGPQSGHKSLVRVTNQLNQRFDNLPAINEGLVCLDLVPTVLDASMVGVGHRQV